MIRLQNSQGVRVDFSEQGVLLGFTSRSVRWEPDPSAGWSVRLCRDGQCVQATPGGDVRFEQADDGESIRFCWDSLSTEDGATLKARAEAAWHVRDELLELRVEIGRLPPPYSLRAVCVPDVVIPYSGATRLIVPKDTGRVIEDAAALLFERDDSPGAYSIEGEHIQLSGWAEGDRGLYMDFRDTRGWTKRWNWMGAGRNKVRIRVDHFAPKDPGAGERGFSLPYPAMLGGFDGHWFDCATIYRSWALRQSWAQRGQAERPGYVAETACWLWNRGPSTHVMEPAEELARRIGLPVTLDWYWWHKHPYDTGYPDYFPPREGTESVTEAVRAFQKNGNTVQVYTNGMSWDMTLPSWETTGKTCAVIREDGSPWNIVYNTWVNRPLAHMCGASETWHDVVLDIARQANELGLDGLYLDQISCAGGRHPCFHEEHGHPPGGGDYAMEGFRRMLDNIRNSFPDLVLTSEATQEHLMDKVEGGITLSTSFERFRFLPDPLQEAARPIPLVPAVYHGRGVWFGNGALLDSIPPYDDFWPAEQRPDRSREKDWHALCPDQFAFELARTLAFGIQPMIANLTRAHLENEAYTEDVDFLVRVSRFYHANRAWLLWGTMLHPGELACDFLTVRSVMRNVFTPPDDVRIVAHENPRVLHSVWQAADGRRMLMLINYTPTPATFSFRPGEMLTCGEKPASDIRTTPDGLAGELAPRSLIGVPLVERS